MRGAAFLDGDGQEVAGHVRHQHLFHAAETRPPRHLVQVQVQRAGGRLVQQVRLVQQRQFRRTAGVGAGRLLQQRRGREAAAVLRPASLCVPSVCVQVPLRVEAPVGTAAGDCAGGRVVVVVVVAVVVVFLTVTVVLWVAVRHSEQPQILALPKLSVSVAHVAHLLLRSRPAQLGRRRAAAAVLEAQLRLRASFLGEVQSIWTGWERRQAEVTGAQFRRLDTYAFSAVYGAGRENGGHDGSETLSGPGGGHGLWGGVGDVHPPN